jgi:16S rRNA C967 or C1407 C5-methylase (RsmB/RsmF family)
MMCCCTVMMEEDELVIKEFISNKKIGELQE